MCEMFRVPDSLMNGFNKIVFFSVENEMQRQNKM